MRNLWIFISKYNAFFLFVIFFVASLLITINNNSFQKASALNSSSRITGEAYARINQLKSYISLGAVNDSLAQENARLKNELKSSLYSDSLVQNTVKDTLYKQQYTYIVARVINNSIHQKNNYITIDRGRLNGLARGMGVIGPAGIVGIVLNVSDHFATVQSLLHRDTRISATIEDNNTFGSLVWGEDNFDPTIATLKDIPSHVKVKRGQKVVTSGFSLFPHGITIGTVLNSGVKGGESFLDIQVKLATDFSNLRYVYVVKNSMALEQQQLEAESNKNE